MMIPKNRTPANERYIPSVTFQVLRSEKIPYRYFDDITENVARMSQYVPVQRLLPLKYGNQVEIFTIMAKKIKSEYVKIENKGFININLSQKDADHFSDWCTADDRNFNVLATQFASTGHSIKIVWDKKSECFMAMMFCSDPDNSNAGYAISSRSRDIYEVIMLCYYKHFVMCEGDWESQSNPQGGFVWG